MAAPAFGTSSFLAYGAARTTSSVPVPTGVAANDVIVVHLYQEDAAPAVTPPTGFTELTFSTAPLTTGNVLRLRVFWKRATGADSGTYAFTHTSNTTEAIAVRLTGCITSGTPVEVLGSAIDIADASSSTAAVSGTTGGADRLLLWGSGQYNAAATVTQPVGFTLVRDGSDLTVGYKAQATAGATGSITGTMSPGGTHNAATLIGAISPSAQSANVNLSGSGTLTATATSRAIVAVNTSGSGTLSATATSKVILSAGLSGSGTLAATITFLSVSTSASLTGSGTLSAAVVTVAGLSGSGTLSATTALVPIAFAQLSGEGTLTATLRNFRYVFRTPTQPVWYRLAGRGLVGSFDQALSVYRRDGQWFTVLSPAPAELSAADRYYQGGYRHALDDTQRAELIAAGFADFINLEEVPL